MLTTFNLVEGQPTTTLKDEQRSVEVEHMLIKQIEQVKKFVNRLSEKLDQKTHVINQLSEKFDQQERARQANSQLITELNVTFDRRCQVIGRRLDDVINQIGRIENLQTQKFREQQSQINELNQTRAAQRQGMLYTVFKYHALETKIHCFIS